ncbi:hypothetical protein NKH48_14155 [Mesorhizobium sp. M1233]|uniref:hypothetical protein n=1 Tax=Mesorhizobium sp. M1233 TaxID=2957072 RepID=UPI003335E9CB
MFVNALRAIRYEYRHVVAQGIHHLTRIKEIVEEPKSNLPELVSPRMPGPYRSNCMQDEADRGQDRAVQEAGDRNSAAAADPDGKLTR